MAEAAENLDSNLRHEIRAHLDSLVRSSESVLDMAETKEVKEIMDQQIKIVGIVQDLLDLTKKSAPPSVGSSQAA